jgi:prephenate dehydrogenase
MTHDDTTNPLGILGFGHFGRALGDLAQATGLQWLAADPHADTPAAQRAEDAQTLAARCRVIVLCVPVPAFESVLTDLLPALSPEHLVLDVGSVKAWPSEVMGRVLGGEVPWCATHPLFGPISLARGERPLRVVVCPNADHPTALRVTRVQGDRTGRRRPRPAHGRNARAGVLCR